MFSGASTSIEQERVEKAIRERDTLYRQYRATKKRDFETLCRISGYGDRLRKFAATLNHFGIEHAARMRLYVEDECRQWLRDAPQDIRNEALSLVGNRIVQVRQRAGLVPFDDPLPDEPDKIFQTVKRMLAA
jgi:hypothetical protein